MPKKRRTKRDPRLARFGLSGYIMALEGMNKYLEK